MLDLCMSNKYKDKYRSESIRLKSWDYRWNAYYFVTICTKNREHFFGCIETDEMNLSEVGEFAVECWLEIPVHFPFVKLGEFIVMPNHVHGIIQIEKQHVETQDFASQVKKTDDEIFGSMYSDIDNESKDRNSRKTNSVINKETQDFASLPNQNYRQKTLNKFGPQSKNLGSVVRGFKIGVTKRARSIGQEFSWQPRFHDHIIRDEESYHRISEYIQWNPRNWKTDKYR